jgi:flagellar L-ring protein precursor FlgH
MRHWMFLFLLPAGLAAQSLYVDGADPYAAKRRFRPGDLIQLSVSESFTADRQSGQVVSRVSGLNAAVSTGSATGGIQASANVGTNGTNSGSTQESDQLITVVTVRVESLRDDGGLEVKGERLVDLGGEEEKLSLTGVLRPEDIGLDMTATSQRLYDEQLHLSGKGTAWKGGHLGWLHSLLAWVGL